MKAIIVVAVLTILWSPSVSQHFCESFLWSGLKPILYQNPNYSLIIIGEKYWKVVESYRLYIESDLPFGSSPRLTNYSFSILSSGESVEGFYNPKTKSLVETKFDEKGVLWVSGKEFKVEPIELIDNITGSDMYYSYLNTYSERYNNVSHRFEYTFVQLKHKLLENGSLRLSFYKDLSMYWISYYFFNDGYRHLGLSNEFHFFSINGTIVYCQYYDCWKGRRIVLIDCQKWSDEHPTTTTTTTSTSTTAPTTVKTTQTTVTTTPFSTSTTIPSTTSTRKTTTTTVLSTQTTSNSSTSSPSKTSKETTTSEMSTELEVQSITTPVISEENESDSTSAVTTTPTTLNTYDDQNATEVQTITSQSTSKTTTKPKNFWNQPYFKVFLICLGIFVIVVIILIVAILICFWPQIRRRRTNSEDTEASDFESVDARRMIAEVSGLNADERRERELEEEDKKWRLRLANSRSKSNDELSSGQPKVPKRRTKSFHI